MGSRTVIIGCIMCLLAPSSGRSTTLSLQVPMDEEMRKGTVVADMMEIFGLEAVENTKREFSLLANERLQLSHTLVRLVKDYVNVDPSSGMITLERKIDRDSLCGRSAICKIKVQVMMLPKEELRLLNLDIIIRDVNDNAPIFPTNPIILNISEDIGLNEVVNLNSYKASDIDYGNNSNIVYSLTPNPYFNIEQYEDEAGNGHLQLHLLKRLDYEQQTTHQFQLAATDQGTTPRSDLATLVINVIDNNDNTPIFERTSYLIFVEENCVVGTKVGQVKAKDLDREENGQLTYKFANDASLSSQTEASLLSIDPETGDIFLQKELNQHRDNGLKLQVEATDKGNPPLSSRVWLTLRVQDVNDHDPDIKINLFMTILDSTAYLSESTPVGKSVAYLSATDNDRGSNGEVEISIQTIAVQNSASSSKENLSFPIGSREVKGQFTLVGDGLIQTGKPFDRETINQYLVIVKACDMGIPRRCSRHNISIRITDENDNLPEFEKPTYEVIMSEAAKIGTDVIRVVAHDRDSLNGPAKMINGAKQVVPSTNGDIEYSVSTEENRFAINQESGQVVLRRPLDMERRSVLKVVITASDRGNPPKKATCLLVVKVTDVNDNPPIFLSPTEDNSTVYASINLDQPIAHIKVVDYDKERNGEFTVDIIEIDNKRDEDGITGSWNLFKVFILDKKSGDLYLNKTFEYLENILGIHHVTIQAVDNGEPPLKSKVKFFIDVSDLLVLPTQPQKDPLLAPGSPPLSLNILLLIIISSSLSLFIIILVTSLVVLKHRKANKMNRSYDCNKAENENGCLKSQERSSKDDHLHEDRSAPSGDDVTMRQITPSHGGRSVSSIHSVSMNRDPATSTATSADQLHNGYPVVTSHRTHSYPGTNNIRIPLSSTSRTLMEESMMDQSKMGFCNGPLVTSSQVDMDSGRGDSEVEGSYLLGAQEKKTSGCNDMNKPQNSLGKCTLECAVYGHSDSCWMPETDQSLLGKSGLATIREMPPLRMKRISEPLRAPAMRGNPRKSLCLALMGGQERHHHPFRSEPTYPYQQSDESAKLRHLWGKMDDSPYSSVFGSNRSSPAPPNGSESTIGNKEKMHFVPERQALLQKERYLSLTTNERGHPDEIL